MWITEIHHRDTGALIWRYKHGPSYRVAMDMHSSVAFRYADHRVHLIWED